MRFGGDDGARWFAVAGGLADVDRNQVVAGDTMHNLDVHAVVVAELDLRDFYMFVAHNWHLRLAVLEHDRVVGNHR